jgi:hypothetical protein
MAQAIINAKASYKDYESIDTRLYLALQKNAS